MKSRRQIYREVIAEDLDLSPADTRRLVRLRVLAQLGGRARAKVLTAQRRQQIAKAASVARWGAKS